ncbi:MAG: hypothetical protein QOG75_3809 [Mycobacterium sp.]|nr:hypothetical protein [Mycobacterium sp.]
MMRAGSLTNVNHYMPGSRTSSKAVGFFDLNQYSIEHSVAMRLPAINSPQISSLTWKPP